MTYFRPASIDDVPALSALIGRAFDPRYGEGWTSPQLLATMVLPGTAAEVAVVDGHVAGFALTRTIVDEVELLLVAVDPSGRRRGLGRDLVARAIAQSRIAGAVRLHLEVRDSNVAAMQLYLQLDFVCVGRRQSYYCGADNQRFDAITMSLPL